MTKFKVFGLMLVIGVGLLQSPGFAQSPPKHTRLIYEASLTSQNHDQLEITNFGGFFIEGKGWSPGNTSSHLRIQFPDYLPPEGTVEFKATNFDPYHQAPATDGKYNIASLDSRGDSFDNAYGTAKNSTDGSWHSFQVMREDASPAKRGLQVFSGCRGFDSNIRSDHQFNEPWNPSKVYTFKLIWTETEAWLVVNGLNTPVSLPPNNFWDRNRGGQVETFLYMDLGHRPGLVNGGLPGPHYFDLKVYTNAANFIFKDISFSHGVHGGLNHKGDHGVAISDVNNDNRLDLYVTNTGNYDVTPFQALANSLYRNDDTHFTEDAAAWGLDAKDQVKYQAIYFDMDKDGDFDVFIARNYYDNTKSIQGLSNLLLRNDGNKFSNVTPGAMTSIARITQAATAVDIDSDGDIDLVGMNRYSDHETYLNDGNGNFISVSRGIGGNANPNDFCQGIVAGDVNNDGYDDVVVVKQSGTHDLFINNPSNPGYFTNQAGARNFVTPDACKAAFLADYNNDGALDIFLTGTGDGKRIPLLQVFKNNGTGSFTNESANLNIDSESYNIVLADFDNDSFLDIFMAPSNKEQTNIRFVLHTNNGTGGFTRSVTSGLGYSGHDARSAATGDVNNDGKTDLVVACRNNHNYLLKNEIQNSNNYLGCKLEASNGTTAPFGTKVFAYQSGHEGDPKFLLGLRQAQAANGHLSQCSPILHFGLGSHQVVDLTVIWPGGKTISYKNVKANQVVELGGLPGTMAIFAGNNQNGTLGYQLAEPFVVIVHDGAGNPAPGVPVTFVVTEGGGQLSNAQPVVTDNQGKATSTLTLGSLKINNVVEASSPGLIGSPVTFTATATSGFPERLQIAKGADQAAPVGAILADSITVRLLGDTDRPVPDYPTQFQITAGAGLLDPGAVTTVEITTDDYGLARVSWKLGTTTGTNTVQVNANWDGTPVQNSPAMINATANAGPATRIQYLSGNGQAGAVGQPLGAPFCVQVFDSYNNMVPGKSIQFVVTAGNGNFDGANSKTVATNANGHACATLTLGNTFGANNNTAEARASGLDGSPIVFVASASISTPHSMYIVSGNNQTGIAGKALADSFVVQVDDEFGNPVPGTEVNFAVTTGAGNLAGASSLKILTKSDGRATALLTLGPVAATNNNQVQVTSSRLPAIVLNFVASAQPANPAKLNKISGDGQTGPTGATLTEPLTVKVFDNFDNPVAGQPVRFEVQDNNSLLEGEKARVRFTNASGLAQVSITLGSTPGTTTVHATGEFNGTALQGSPAIFNFQVRAGQADSIYLWTGNYQMGYVNSPLHDSICVRIVDASGYPIRDHQVIFTVKQGGGNFDGATYKIRFTNNQGVASALPALGPDTGNNNNMFEAQANGMNSPLKGSPVRFVASARASAATKMQVLAGNNQTGIVGQPLPTGLQVRVQGAESQNIANHPVLFTVKEGNGTLDNGLTVVEKRTNLAGIAEVTLTLSRSMGIHKVEATANDGVNPLTGSPSLFTATALADVPDPVISTITATSPISADGISNSQITITIHDKYHNPVSGRTVLLSATGTGNNLVQPVGLTNGSGVTTGYLSTTVAENKKISALVVNDNVFLADTITVKFTAGKASRIDYVSGNSQTGHIGSYLPEPLLVRVSDNLGNGVQGYPVQFVITSGSGTLVETQPVFTDSLGLAQTNVIMGRTPGNTCRIEARAPSLAGSPISFLGTALILQPVNFIKISGDNQVAWANTTLPESLVVCVLGPNDAGLWGIPVTFNIQTGGGRVSPAVALTNELGQAWTKFTLGPSPGLNEVSGTISGLTKTLTFQATAKVGMPAELNLVAGNGQIGIVHATLAQPLVVAVKDVVGNPVPGAQVLFSAEKGGNILTPQPVITGASGQATARVSLGDTTGHYRFNVKLLGTTIPDTFFTVIALPGPAKSLIKINGNNQTGIPFAILKEPLVVKVADSYGNGVSGINVTFSIITGSGSIIENQPVQSDADGLAQVHWKLGRELLQSCKAETAGLENSPIIFVAFLAANQAPVLSVVTDTTIKENSPIEFFVTATDPEQDVLIFRARNLPAGSAFDSTNTRKFSWTPNYNQAGIYQIKFFVWDILGAVDSSTTTIRVTNTNRPPNIIMFSPSPLELPKQPYFTQVEFCVTAIDPDQDALFYHWSVNDVRFSSGSCFSVVPNSSWPPLSYITVWVSDKTDSINLTWSVPTVVNLSVFTAIYEPFKGIQLHWETTSEGNNAGFNVFKSPGEEDGYARINSELILPETSKSYLFLDADVKAGHTYFYKLQDVDVSGAVSLHGPIKVTVAIPDKFELSQNFPNPFNPTTTIQFSISQPGHVKLAIFNVYGQQVKILVDSDLSPGFHKVTWDGRDNADQVLPSGIYYYQVQSQSFKQMKKLLLLK